MLGISLSSSNSGTTNSPNWKSLAISITTSLLDIIQFKTSIAPSLFFAAAFTDIVVPIAIIKFGPPELDDRDGKGAQPHSSPD